MSKRRLIAWLAFAALLVGVGLTLHEVLPPEPRWSKPYRASSALFSPDGRYVVVRSPFDSDGKPIGAPVQLWDAETGAIVRHLATEATSILESGMTADSSTWAGILEFIGEEDRPLEGFGIGLGHAFKPQEVLDNEPHSDSLELRIVTIQSGTERRIRLNLVGEKVSQLTPLQFDASGKTLLFETKLLDPGARGDGFCFHVFDAESGEKLASFRHSEPLSESIVDGRYLVYSAEHEGSKRIHKWDMVARRQISDFGPILSEVTYSPSGRLIADADFDGAEQSRDLRRLRLWHAVTGTCDNVGPARPWRDFGFSPDSRLLYISGEKLEVWETNPLRLRGDWNEKGVYDFAFSPDSNLLLATCRAVPDPTELVVLDCGSLTPLWRRAISPDLWGWRISNDTATIAVTDSEACAFRVLDARSGIEMKLIPWPATREKGKRRLNGFQFKGDLAHFRVSEDLQPLTQGPIVEWGLATLRWLLRFPGPGNFRETQFDVVADGQGRIVFVLEDPALASSELQVSANPASPSAALLTDHSEPVHEIRYYDIPARKPWRWVVGPALAFGVAVLLVCAGWRRRRRSKLIVAA